jgi:sodium transport system ATP-binding protein
MIAITNLVKEYKLSKRQQKEWNTTENTVRAVDDITFTCQPGRVFSLLGPNGAGKTTTLRMISTILAPTSGTVNVNGFDTVGAAQDVRKTIGFLTGTTGLYQRLTANEIIKYFADLYGVSKEDYKQRKERLFDLLDMNDFANKRIGQLSTGMKQKVSITRTMIHDPQVVVFDEPTSGLDVITAENIIELIRDCKTQGKTVIFSSHIMSEVDLLCDDLAIIYKGKLLYSDTMENFRTQIGAKSLTEAFISIVKNNEVLSDKSKN